MERVCMTDDEYTTVGKTPHLKNANQSIYQACAVNDSARYGLLYSHFLDRTFKRIKNKSTPLYSPLYREISYKSTFNTF